MRRRTVERLAREASRRHAERNGPMTDAQLDDLRCDLTAGVYGPRGREVLAAHAERVTRSRWLFLDAPPGDPAAAEVRRMVERGLHGEIDEAGRIRLRPLRELVN